MNLEQTKNKLLDGIEFLERKFRDNKKDNIEVVSILVKDDEFLIDIKEKK